MGYFNLPHDIYSLFSSINKLNYPELVPFDLILHPIRLLGLLAITVSACSDSFEFVRTGIESYRIPVATMGPIIMCELMQLQYGLVRIDGSWEARGTNLVEMTELIEEKMKYKQGENVLKCLAYIIVGKGVEALGTPRLSWILCLNKGITTHTKSHWL